MFILISELSGSFIITAERRMQGSDSSSLKIPLQNGNSSLSLPSEDNTPSRSH